MLIKINQHNNLPGKNWIILLLKINKLYSLIWPLDVCVKKSLGVRHFYITLSDFCNTFVQLLSYSTLNNVCSNIAVLTHCFCPTFALLLPFERITFNPLCTFFIYFSLLLSYYTFAHSCISVAQPFTLLFVLISHNFCNFCFLFFATALTLLFHSL